MVFTNFLIAFILLGIMFRLGTVIDILYDIRKNTKKS